MKQERKRRIPKYVKKWFSQRKKISNMIMKTKCNKRIVKLMEELDLIERKIYESKEKRRKLEEDKVIDDIKVNPKAFYKFAKKKSVIKSNIGPFLVNGKLVREEVEMAKILRKQYESI